METIDKLANKVDIEWIYNLCHKPEAKLDSMIEEITLKYNNVTADEAKNLILAVALSEASIKAVKDLKKDSMSLKVKEYRLMYLWGAWVCDSKIYAESDDEAIFDADELMIDAKAKDKLRYALFCGNKKVKEYNQINK